MSFVTVVTWQSPLAMMYKYHSLGSAAIKKSVVEKAKNNGN
jgi:hypothetical protein